VTFEHELGPALVALLVPLAGGLAGFLVWNRNPAKMFMGNCGSLAIGGIVAAAATVAIARAGTPAAAAAAALILVVPIFDSAFVVLLRRLAGRSTTRGNIDHTSHRLVSAGFTDKTAVSLLYALGAAGALIGYLVHTHIAAGLPVAAAFGIAVVMMALWLVRVPAYAGQDFQALQSAPFAPLLSDLTFRWHAGEVLLDLVLITTCYYTAYRIRFEGDADLPVFLTSLLAVAAGDPRVSTRLALPVGPVQENVEHVRAARPFDGDSRGRGRRGGLGAGGHLSLQVPGVLA